MSAGEGSGKLGSVKKPSALAPIRRGLKSLLVFLLLSFFWIFLAFLAMFPAREATGVHWLAGLAVSLISITLLICFTLWWAWLVWTQRYSGGNVAWRRFHTWFGKGHLTVRLWAVLVFITLFAILGMSNISLTLHVGGVVNYELPEQEISRILEDPRFFSDTLIAYYGWHFIDSIPILQIWQTFNIDPPTSAEGHWDGILVLVFRVLIIGPSIFAITKWLEFRSAISHEGTGKPLAYQKDLC